jgi:hypothetical protein
VTRRRSVREIPVHGKPFPSPRVYDACPQSLSGERPANTRTNRNHCRDSA